MAPKKWTTELPGDMVGQKTTAIPIANLGEAEWVTPVHISSSTSLPVNVTFPASLNVADSTARSSLSAIDTKLAGTLIVADSTARNSLSAIDTKLGGTLNVADATSRTSLSAIDTKLGGTLKTQVTNWPATQPVSGSVSVSNFPATQPVSGSVSVTGTTTVAGSVSVTGTTTVAGSVSITGTPTVSVSGTAAVSDATARTSLSSIDTKLSGTLNINDANGTAKLTTIDTKLGGTLNVADATARTSLSAIDTKLGGTLNVASSTLLTELQNVKTELQNVKSQLSGVLNTRITESTIMQPVEIQGNLQTTIQTQNGVAVTAGSLSTGSGWIDTVGFNQVAGTLITSVGTVATNITVNWSNDGVNVHGVDNIITNGQGTQRSGITDTKARYMQVYLYNGNTAGQPPSTMSGWVYLKA